MSQAYLKAEVSRNALLICRERISNKSTETSSDILELIQGQLEWLVEYFEGHREMERNRLQEIKIGFLAAREIDDSDEEFINALYNAQYVADQTAAGLKIDLKNIRDDS